MATAKPENPAYRLLVSLLHEAAELENCLLSSYLYAACSLKSTPAEFAEVQGQPNARAAIQFERVRAWKQSLLFVSHEEMLHLHYVQCMLRSLGEAPHFQLPARDPATGNWLFKNWQAQVAGTPDNDGKGVEIPVQPLTLPNLSRFVLYESTDALQDNDPFGPANTQLFEQLQAFELDFRLESMLLNEPDPAKRDALKEQLRALYVELPPQERGKAEADLLVAAGLELPPVEELRFQSIADFYVKGILPLFEQAFDQGWVTHHNLDLNYEQLNPDYAGEGFLPVGPVYRSQNFQKSYTANIQDPLKNYRRVDDIIREIVEEGEGNSKFEHEAADFLRKVQELGGARPYLLAWLKAKNPANPSPDWLDNGENLRQSHLYRFAMMLAEMRRERQLMQPFEEFTAVRQTASVSGSPRLTQLVEELPAQFNSCYLVMIMWLARMYEIKDWAVDKPQREAIEMLASWPLMSIAIRPMLELASCFPVELQQLFRIDGSALPLLPIHAQQLSGLFGSADRSEAINDQMDYLAVRVLADVASWAATQADVVSQADLPADLRELALTRLKGLTILSEFQKQFDFRTHGGYSNRLPDLAYQQQHTAGNEFEEDPTTVANLFESTFALRLRFTGWGRVQLATDPDPPTDEAGCTGTHMLHPADGKRRFNRALVWQATDPATTIVREPQAELPPLGVNCADLSLLVAAEAQAGYVPLQVLQSAGAVQTSGVQQDLQVAGFGELLRLTPAQALGEARQLRLNLQDKAGAKPLLFGENHLVWRDGEPIDPLVLALLADPDPATGGPPALVCQREIFNFSTSQQRGVSLKEMTPYQRQLSQRAPVGFDSVTNIPAWAKVGLSARQQELMASPSYPMSYLRDRTQVLETALAAQLADGRRDQAAVNEIISLAERMSLVAVPRGTTVAWLNFTLHYGHTISGNLATGPALDELLTAFKAHTGLPLTLAPSLPDRTAPNARWLFKYSLGMMDTDALANLVFGELYLPLALETGAGPINFQKTWTFPAALAPVLATYAAQFAHPFWAQFEVSGNERRATVPTSQGSFPIVETLVQQTDDAYQYTMTGVPGVTNYHGSFAVTTTPDQALLTWQVTFEATPAAAVLVANIFSGAQQTMGTTLQTYLYPNQTDG